MKKRSLGRGNGGTPVTDDRPAPMFIADHPGLDFLNSIGTPADTVVEWICNGEDLLAWLVEAKLIDPAEVAAKVVAAIRNGELYIFTHPNMRQSVDGRFAAIQAAMDRVSS